MIVRDEPASPPELTEIIAETRRQIEAEHTPPRLHRDAHPKMHGCVQARLTLHPDCPDTLQQGVFASVPDTGYKAWVRYSNAFRIQHDLEIETRGMAVKLLDVTGTPLPEAERIEVRDTPSYTQDFLFATHDAFFLPNPSEYLDFLKCVRRASSGTFAFYRDRFPRLWSGFVALVVSQVKGATPNPLSLTYFSQTPYRLGGNIVKLRMRPADPPRLRWYLRLGFLLILLLANIVFFVLEPITKRGKAWAERFCDYHFVNRDFLRLAMIDTLAVRDMTFVLEAQEWNTIGDADLNNACLRWDESAHPFKPVATLRIPSQTFWPQSGLPRKMFEATSDLVSLGENMSFNPWHGLIDHEPLGSINTARRWVYRDIARFRRDANHIDAAAMPGVQHRSWDRLQPYIQSGNVT